MLFRSGPCGPCSEIYYDRGPQYGKEGGPIADEDRYLEVWNLVFMQNIRGAGAGKEDFPILGELPAKNIDTGLGLERMAALLQGVENIYDIDTTKMILDRAVELTGVKYGSNEKSDVSLRVIADHARTSMMLIGDGVVPAPSGVCPLLAVLCGLVVGKSPGQRDGLALVGKGVQPVLGAEERERTKWPNARCAHCRVAHL